MITASPEHAFTPRRVRYALVRQLVVAFLCAVVVAGFLADVGRAGPPMPRPTAAAAS